LNYKYNLKKYIYVFVLGCYSLTLLILLSTWVFNKFTKIDIPLELISLLGGFMGALLTSMVAVYVMEVSIGNNEELQRRLVNVEENRELRSSRTLIQETLFFDDYKLFNNITKFKNTHIHNSYGYESLKNSLDRITIYNMKI
jgi:hypothetical protein